MRRASNGLVLLTLHVLWALAGLYASVVLLRAGGHPPGLAFLPIALVAWAAGHLFLWGAGWLARAGTERLETGGPAPRRSPAEVVALLATGAVTALGLAGLGSMAFQGELGFHRWSATLVAVWLPHAVCFAALLLRLVWGRAVAAVLACGWIAVLVYQLLHATVPRLWEMALAAGLIVALLLLAAALVRSLTGASGRGR